MTERERSLVEHLATYVLGWTSAGGGIFRDAEGKAHGFALDSWADAGMVLETALKEIVNSFTLEYIGREWFGTFDDGLSRCDSGPRAICEAVAVATGWQEPEGGERDGKG